jgi:hypothetical protein
MPNMDTPKTLEACGLINILLPRKSRLPLILGMLVDWRFVLTLGMAVLIGWRWFAPGVPLPRGMFFTILGAVVLLAISKQILISRRRARRKAQQAGKETDGTSSPSTDRPALRDLLQSGAGLGPLLSQSRDEEQLIDEFSRTAFSGEALCLSACQQGLITDLEPLAVPFEPMLLDTASARLLQPLGLSETDQGRGLALDFSSLRKLVQQVLLVLRRAGILEGTNFVLLAAAVFSLFFTGLFSRRVLTNAAIIGVSLFLFLRRERVAGHLYVIPGGLVDARRKWVYRRSSGLLVWCADSRMLYALDTGSNPMLSFVVTPLEATTALRAWLSPVEGPSDELIASFLGKDQS